MKTRREIEAEIRRLERGSSNIGSKDYVLKSIADAKIEALRSVLRP